MKTRFIDPFTPDLPVDDPAKFAGRNTAIESVVDSLYQLVNGNPKHVIITGDRGIGKSSVLLQAKSFTQGNFELLEILKIDPGVKSYSFITAWHDCAPDQTPTTLASGILEQLQNEAVSFIKGFKIELNLAGFIKIAEKDTSQATLVEIVTLFCEELKKFSKKASEANKDGIVLFFDELDSVKQNSGVATFFKLSSEKLARDGVKNVAFFAAGITGAVQALEKEHGSIYRTLADIPLARLAVEEVAQILKTGFEKVGCKYDEVVINEIHALCAGYPEPVHLLGSQILKSDKDDYLTIDDFKLAEKDVVETIRKNKLGSMLKAAGAGKYQAIMRAMASHAGSDVPLAYIAEQTGYEQSSLSSNIGTLVKRGIITLVTRGHYTFTDPLLKVYITRFGVIEPNIGDAEDEEDEDAQKVV
ncbi:AAA family ATPase [Pseudomonas prosekii]|uniref:ATP-binding protein n=1 Tax=Pseudomonas prosekii TaxID=1148509 RepID=UPI003F751C43